MNTKLTLSLDEHVIAKAEIYAKMKKTSVTQLIECYLSQLADQHGPELNGVVAELAGIIPDSKFDKEGCLEQKHYDFRN